MYLYKPVNLTRFFTGLLLIGVSAFIIGCDTQRDPDTFTIAVANDIRGFDPAMATDIATGKVISYVYDNLVRFDTGTGLVPSLAKSWSLSADRRTYTFLLTGEARFHDGSFITARDVIFSFQRLLDPETTSPQTWLLDRVAGAREFMEGITDLVKGLSAPNDSTLIIAIEKPFAPFIQYLAMPSTAVVNSRRLLDITNRPAGSGPWILDHWERDGELIFNRNNNYWADVPRVRRFRIRILGEAMTQIAEFEAGNLDLLGIPDMELPMWQARPEWRDFISTLTELNIYYIGLNCARPPFNDIRVRQAMNLALDREKILELLLAGSGILASGPVHPQLLINSPPDPYPYNPQQARELLKAAGYQNGLKSKLWVAGGLEMYQVLEAMQSYWKAVGIDVDIMRSDWNVFKTAVREGKPDLYYLNWFADYPDAENFLYPLFHSAESMTKRNRFSDPEVDRIIEGIQDMPEGPERDDLIAKANQMVFEKVPWVFLWYSQTNTIVQPWVHNYQQRIIFNAQRFTEVVIAK